MEAFLFPRCLSSSFLLLLYTHISFTGAVNVAGFWLASDGHGYGRLHHWEGWDKSQTSGSLAKYKGQA